MKTLFHIAGGLASAIPGFERRRQPSTGGSDSARYCYSVWMRHLVMAAQNGYPTRVCCVGELGPGDSIGVGLTALLTGAEEYRGLDTVPYMDQMKNIPILEELIELLRRRADIPGEDEFPLVKPFLNSYKFPDKILSDEHLDRCLSRERIETIRQSLVTIGSNRMIQYCAPWNHTALIEPASLDMVFSQAVLEHVNEPRQTYDCMFRWLKSGGFVSHQIDFKSHGFAEVWNGHWQYSDLTWRLIVGFRHYLINRQPCSAHLRFVKDAGFEQINVVRVKQRSSVERDSLAKSLRSMADEDLVTSGVFIQARKP